MAKPALSETGERLYQQLEPVFFKRDEQNGWAGALLVSGLAKMFDQAAEVVQPSAGKPGFAILFEPQRCPVTWLPWLGQFVGIDPVAIEALIKEGKVSTARSWIEHPISQERGLVKAMTEAAKNTLTGTKTLYFYPRYNGEAFLLKAASLEIETPNATATREAIERYMPAWIVLQYETVKGGTIAIAEAAHAKVSETEAADTTISELELHPEK